MPFSWIDAARLAVLGSWFGILAVLAAYGLHRLFILALYWRHRGERPPMGRLDELPDARLPRVTVQLPVYNEANVVTRLVDAAARLDWPRDRLDVQVLDDSTDETAVLAEAAARRWRERGVDVRVLRREARTGFKAGALAAGLREARGELVAIFDADFIPPPDFLRRVVPAFLAPGAERLGMVQARWAHDNEEANLLTRLEAVLLDGHFVLEHTARNRSGRFFNFNGTAGVWRRACIEEAGGWQHDTLTEDLDLSYRAQMAGWRFLFLPEVAVPAELPTDMDAFLVQQHRWAKGTMQTARKLLPRLLRADLPARVKAEALVHLTGNLAYPLALALAALMPLSVALRGPRFLAAGLLVDLPAFLLATASVALYYAAAERELTGSWRAKLARVPLAMALGIGISVNQSRAVLEGLRDRDATFVRTPKAGRAGQTRRRYAARGRGRRAELLLAAWLAGGCAWAAGAGHWGSVPFLALFAAGFALVAFGRPPVALRWRLARQER